ncbi:MAG: hypothetical protein P0Y49_09350 [Candidatus Pedobacter colombiensis]|uniref:Methylamine utilisation protein MauE domain-containing protein n=1 Tax=Candidatus Pedobacter colombiensis TaxID=3121371 RepID=A0AAJ6B9C7_9SPHI|nr:MauE/DoxX family redox-associated membrane protein [Pedobacter sp.]WEK21346.1 MAG: hypothetical protein P0Y49_09350 [Pedobacter sp.]
MNKSLIVKLISYCFILLFLYAVANKLIDYQKFTVQIGQSPILTGYAGIIAWLVPTIEIIISLMLLFDATRVTGLYASFSLMTMFTAYIIVILNFAERVPCSCGGILEKMGWREHLVFNIAFVLLAVTAIVVQSKHNLQDRLNPI